MNSVKLFLLSYPIFIVVDILWLGFIMRPVYRQQIGFLTKIVENEMHVNWPAALLVWALIVLGALLFVLSKTDGTLMSGFLWGAVYGLILYGVYDLTNLALIDRWPLLITLIDIIWGMVINGLLGALLVLLNKYV